MTIFLIQKNSKSTAHFIFEKVELHDGDSMDGVLSSAHEVIDFNSELTMMVPHCGIVRHLWNCYLVSSQSQRQRIDYLQVLFIDVVGGYE